MPADYDATEAAAYLSEHEVLQRINLAITDAVRERARNPLLHMAEALRRPKPTATAAASTGATAAPPPIAAPAPVPASLVVPGSGVFSRSSSFAPAPGGAAASTASISGLLRPSSVDELARLLREDGVDLSLWGVAGAKSVRQLLAEMSATECTLRQPVSDGPLVRELTRVDIELILRGRVLVETHTQAGGRTLQRFKLLSVRLREGENWQAGVRRVLKSLLRWASADGPHGYALQEGTHTVETTTRAAYSYPGLTTECTRHFITVVLDERSNQETLGIAGQDRFNTIEYPESMTHVAVMTTRIANDNSTNESLPIGYSRESVIKHHWAWYFQREWATIQRKMQLEALARANNSGAGGGGGESSNAVNGGGGGTSALNAAASGGGGAAGVSGAAGSGGGGGAVGGVGGGLKPCTDIRFDGIGESQIMDDDLGPEETQARVLGLLYMGCETLWYHCIDGEASRARILHVQVLLSLPPLPSFLPQPLHPPPHHHTPHTFPLSRTHAGCRREWRVGRPNYREALSKRFTSYCLQGPRTLLLVVGWWWC